MKTILFTFLGCFLVLPNFAQNDSVNDSIILRKPNNSEIKIRCQASSRNDAALFIMDGVPVVSGDRTFENLNPEDIVSIEVLKNAQALMCYGTAAQNGVVLISTKASSQAIVLEKDPPFKVHKIRNTNWNTIQDVYNAIQSKVPNVSISPSSDLGVVPNIRMRGDDNTIVIVDGIRYDASILNTLNPADIESVKVSNSTAAQNYFLIR